MHTLAPPSESDWGEPSADMDRAYAFKIFAGKTYDEAMNLFETTDLLSRVEDLGNMPDVPFRYYVLAFRDFVLSRRVLELNWGITASTAASSFLDIIEFKLERNPDSIRPILADLLPAAEHVAERQIEYDADEDIYGRFPDAMRRIRALAADA